MSILGTRRTKRRRVLFLLPFAPRLDATDGAARAMAQHLVNLAEQHTLALLVLRAPDEPQVDPLLRERCDLVEEIERPVAAAPGGLDAAFNRAAALLRGTPVWIRDSHVAAYAERVTTLARDWQPHIVQIEYQAMAHYLPNLSGCAAPQILSVYEPHAEVLRELSNADQAPSRWLPSLDALAWRRYERAIVGKVQAVVVSTERDRQAIEQYRRRTPIVVLPSTTPIPASPLNTLGGVPPALLFVGNFAHAPNLDAARRLVGTIFPQVHAQRPDVRLWLVGDQPPDELRTLAGDAAVTVTGWVPDLRPYMEAATAVVVPLRLSSGTQVQIMEALAAGKAVIASRVAVEGLEITPGQQYLAAETDEEFEIAILRMIVKSQQRMALGSSAYVWAQANLGWQRIGPIYDRLYEQLLQYPARGYFGRHARYNAIEQSPGEGG